MLIGWITHPDTVRNHTNEISYYSLGKWWNICIKFVTPVILTYMLIQSVLTEIQTPYGGYKRVELFTYGWGIIALGIIIALIITKKKWRNEIFLDDSKVSID